MMTSSCHVMSYEAAKQRNRDLLEETRDLGIILEKFIKITSGSTSGLELQNSEPEMTPRVLFMQPEVTQTKAEVTNQNLNKEKSESEDNLHHVIPPEMSTQLISDSVNIRSRDSVQSSRDKTGNEPEVHIEDNRKLMSPLARAAEIFSQSSSGSDTSGSESEPEVTKTNQTENESSTIHGVATMQTNTGSTVTVKQSKTQTGSSNMPTGSPIQVKSTGSDSKPEVIDPDSTQLRKENAIIEFRNSTGSNQDKTGSPNQNRKSSRSKSLTGSQEKEIILQSPRIADLRRETISTSGPTNSTGSNSKKSKIQFSTDSDTGSETGNENSKRNSKKSTSFKFLESPRISAQERTSGSVKSTGSPNSKTGSVTSKKMTPRIESKETGSNKSPILSKTIGRGRGSRVSSSSEDGEGDLPWYEKEKKAKNEPKLFATSFNALDDDDDSFSFE
jgi:hypothetical protein